VERRSDPFARELGAGTRLPPPVRQAVASSRAAREDSPPGGPFSFGMEAVAGPAKVSLLVSGEAVA
jgi:hypothetical protein